MKPLVLYGAGGLGREIALLVRASSDFELVGFIDDSASGEMLGYPVLGGFDALCELRKTKHELGVVVTVGSSSALEAIAAKIASAPQPIERPNISHPSASIDWEFVDAGVGNVVCAGARVNNATFGEHNIINMNTVLGHDCVLGSRNLISPSATLNGEVVVASDVTIGAGATIMPRVEIGSHATVAIGAVVGKSVKAGETVAGNPARVVARREVGE